MISLRRAWRRCWISGEGLGVRMGLESVLSTAVTL